MVLCYCWLGEPVVICFSITNSSLWDSW